MRRLYDIIENTIIELFEDFKQNPEDYENEKILTYKFYDIISKKGFQNYNFRWEYPTKAFYRGDEPDNSSKKHKDMDICFIEDSSNSVPFALEFKLKLTNEGENNFNPSNFDVIDPDFNELIYSENMINIGFIIFFAFIKIVTNEERKKVHPQNKGYFFDKFEKLISQIESENTIKIIFACIDNIDGYRTCSIRHNFNNVHAEVLDKQY